MAASVHHHNALQCWRITAHKFRYSPGCCFLIRESITQASPHPNPIHQTPYTNWILRMFTAKGGGKRGSARLALPPPVSAAHTWRAWRAAATLKSSRCSAASPCIRSSPSRGCPASSGGCSCKLLRAVQPQELRLLQGRPHQAATRSSAPCRAFTRAAGVAGSQQVLLQVVGASGICACNR